ncbi:unnamed protein product [Durusdinium trenchii]|uniref:Glycerophosphocholine acyltransferase 1 n=3 Tax=Durusdinium trenchii TaxID=1381693 RepID=A0ABP0IXS5_9DINO
MAVEKRWRRWLMFLCSLLLLLEPWSWRTDSKAPDQSRVAFAFRGQAQTQEPKKDEVDEVDEDIGHYAYSLNKDGPLGWLHYDVILASRTSYPLALMIGFTCYGNVILRKESGDKPYPSWIFGWLLGMVCYTYPGAIFSDLMFVRDAPQRALSNNNILWCFSFWFLVVQNSDAAYKFLQGKHVFVWLTTWWLADATRASLLFLERAVEEQPVFARGVWQAFVWCGAGPVARLIEKSIRGEPVPTLDKVQPNSLNFLKFPLVAMFWNMIFYLCCLAFLTDCGFLSSEPKLSMVQCGAAHEDFYGFCTYMPCILHLCRAYWATWQHAHRHNLVPGPWALVFKTLSLQHPATGSPAAPRRCTHTMVL